MPNWKKVIVSGSDAVLNHVTASSGIQVQNDILPDSDNVHSLGSTTSRFLLNGGTPVTVTGSGTANTLTRFQSATTVENSQIFSSDTVTRITHDNDSNAIFVVSGSNGELLSVSDDNNDEVLRVNDDNGLAIFTVSASGFIQASGQVSASSFKGDGSALTNLPGGVTGSDTQIQFNDNGELGASSDLVFSGSRLGIGTTSPSEKLTVEGNVSASGVFYAGNGSQSAPAYTFADDPDTGIFRYSPNQLELVAGGSTGIRFGTNAVNIYYGSTPKLATTSTGAEVKGNLVVSGSSGQVFKVIPNNNAKEWYIDTTNPDHLKKEQNLILSADPGDGHSNTVIGFKVDNTTRMQINSSGNVGIGTTSPLAPLDVNGNIYSSGNLLVDTIFSRGGSVDLQIDTRAGYGVNVTSGSTSIAYFDHDTARVGIGTTSPTEKLHVDGNLLVTGTVTAQEFHTEFVSASVIYESGSTKFGDTSDDIHSFTGSLRIQSGSVDIGTYSNGIRFYNGTNYTGNKIQLTSAENLQIKAGSAIQLQTLTQLTNGRIFRFNNTDNTTRFDISNAGVSGEYRLDFTSGSTQLMIISGSGNVGIGTTTPSYNLTVYNDSLTDSFPIVAGSGVSVGEFVGIGLAGYVASAGAVKAGMVLTRVGNFGTGDIHFLNNSTEDNSDATLSDSKLVIKEDGNVGIGNTSPSYKLDITGTQRIVHSSSNTGLWVLTNSAVPSTPQVKIGRDTSQWYGVLVNDGTARLIHRQDETGAGSHYISNEIWTSATGGGQFQWKSGDNAGNNLTELMRLTTTGLGIGTTSPNSKLDVAGSAIFSNSIGVTGANDPGTNAPAAEIQYRTSDKAGRFYGYDRSTTSYLNMSLGNDNLYIPSSSGYVGIGSTNPSEKLEINNGNLLVNPSGSRTTAHNGLLLGFNRHNPSAAGLFGATDGKVQNSDGNLYVSTRNLNAGNGSYIKLGQRDSDTASDKGTVVIQAGTYNTNSQTGDIFLNYGTSDRVTLEGSTGYVGIGDNTPSAKLHIKGDGWEDNTVGSNLLRLEATDTIGAGIALKNKSGGYWNMYHGDTASWVGKGGLGFVYASGSAATAPKVTFAANGTVGIGTTAPTQKLEVRDGNLVVSSSNSEVVIGTSSGKPRMQSNGNQDLLFSTANQTNVLYLQDANGNVGIDTTSPQKKLHVAGHISSSGFYGDGSNLTGITTSDGLADILGNNNEASGQDIDMGSGNITQVGELQGESVNVTTASIAYVTSSANLHIDTNVGIGNNTPSEKLTVEGNISASGDLTLNGDIYKAVENSYLGLYGGSNNTDNDGFIKIHGNSNYWGRVQTNIGYSSANSKAYWTLSNTTELMTLTGAGRLGIGTSTPSSSLHVEGDVQIGSNKLKLGGGNADSYIQHDGSNLITHFQSNWGGDFKFRAADTGGTPYDILFIEGSNQRVGIGTTSPSKTLDVAGTFKASGEAFFSHFDNTTANSRMRDDLYINYGTARVFRIGYNSTTDKLQFGSGSSAIMTLDGDGNLVVEGSITAQEFHTEFVSASIVYESGSTKFGDTSDDNHDFTGSLNVEGNITLGATSPKVYFNDAQDYYIGYNNSTRLLLGLNGADAIIFNRVGSSNAAIWMDQYTSNYSYPAYTFQDDTDTGLTSLSDNTLALVASGSARLYVASDGDVGIGTTSPSERLHVSGAMIIDSGSQATKLDSNRIAVTSTATVISDIDPTVYVGAVFDYTAYHNDKTTGMRTGQVMLAFDESTNVTISDVTTTDIGDTSGVTFTATNNGSSVRVSYNTPDADWNIRLFRRLL